MRVGAGVVVHASPPPGPSALVPLAPQDADEGQLEGAAVAGVDDGVHAAVEVAQPEDHLGDQLRGPGTVVE